MDTTEPNDIPKFIVELVGALGISEQKKRSLPSSLWTSRRWLKHASCAAMLGNRSQNLNRSPSSSLKNTWRLLTTQHPQTLPPALSVASPTKYYDKKKQLSNKLLNRKHTG